MKFPPLNYEPPAPEQFRVQLKSGPVAYVVPDRELPLVNIVDLRSHGRLSGTRRQGRSRRISPVICWRAAARGRIPRTNWRNGSRFWRRSLNSGISGTQGSVSLNLLSKDLDEGLGILRDVLFAPRFQDDKIALRKQQILQAMEQRNDDTSDIEGREAGFLAYGENFWANRYSTAASHGFHHARRHRDVSPANGFMPDNFVVAVSGDFDRDEMVAQTGKAFCRLAVARARSRRRFRPTPPSPRRAFTWWTRT